jgi:hypothetical protein
MPNASKVMKPSTATQISPPNSRPSYTPPGSPTLESAEPTVTFTVKEFVAAVTEVLKEHGVTASTATSGPVESQSDGNAEAKKPIVRASKLEYKAVDEVYVTRSPC